jgi:hypothetical protein
MSGEIHETQSEADVQDLTAQFGTRHILLWTLLSSMTFVLWSSAFREGQVDRPGLSPLLHVFGVLDAVIDAAALTGLIVLLWSRRPWQRIKHPGHWMTLIHATLFVSLLPLHFPASRWLVSNWVFLVVPSFLYLAATLYNRHLWRVYFALSGLLAAAIHLTPYIPMDMRMGFLSVAMQVSQIASPCITLLMLVYAAFDARKRGRDWVHWLGVSVVCLLTVQAICYNTLSSYGWLH